MSSDRPISEDDLHAYVDGVLPPARRATVETFLAQNAAAAERVSRFSRQREALRAALGPVGAEPVPPQLNLEHLVAARRNPRWGGWRAAAAACALLVIGGAGGWVLRGVGKAPQAGTGSLVQEAFVAFSVFGPDRGRPVEIKAADSADLVRWVSNRLAHPVSVPDLSASGYRFMGGRLVATPNGPAGLFMYDDDKGARIAILVRPMTQDGSAGMAAHRDGDVAGYAWADHGIGYSLVGKAAPDRLHPLADEVRRQLDARI